jgi:hypothetical protein
LVFDEYGLHPALGQPLNLGQGLSYGFGNAPWDTTFTNFIKIDSLKTLVGNPTYVLTDSAGFIKRKPIGSVNYWIFDGVSAIKPAVADTVKMGVLNTVTILKTTIKDTLRLTQKIASTADSVLIREGNIVKYRILTLPDTTKNPLMFSPTGSTVQRFNLQKGFVIDDSVTTWHGMKRYQSYIDLSDDDSIIFFSMAKGSGTITAIRVNAGDSIDFADIDFTGQVLHLHNNSSTNVVKTNTDTKFCVGYWTGGNMIIKNRTGDLVRVLMNIRYYIPF